MMSDCPQVRPKELVGNVAAGSTDPRLAVLEIRNRGFVVWFRVQDLGFRICRA